MRGTRFTCALHFGKDMRRIKLIVEYDGTNYAGWQRQKNALSVQQCLEEALYGFTGEITCVSGAGRTDSGVHALGQCAHFDTASNLPADKYSYALNAHLPEDIRVVSSCEVDVRFHCSLHAKGKHYRYTIYNATHANAQGRLTSAHIYHPLNVEDMKRAAADLVGEHDFSAYRSAGSDIKTSVRTVHSIEITQRGNYIDIDVKGNGFLYNMVRIISGTLIDIGRGRLEVGAARHALEKMDRKLAGITAPAKGLTMVEVFY